MIENKECITCNLCGRVGGVRVQGNLPARWIAAWVDLPQGGGKCETVHVCGGCSAAIVKEIRRSQAVSDV